MLPGLIYNSPQLEIVDILMLVRILPTGINRQDENSIQIAAFFEQDIFKLGFTRLQSHNTLLIDIMNS